MFSPEAFVSELVLPADRQLVIEWLRKVCGIISQKDFMHIEHRTVRRDGQVRWIETRANALIGPDGRLLKICGVSQDITEQKVMTMESEAKIGSYLEKIHCQY